MAVNIKDEETDRLARELAEATGQSITFAVKEAIVAQLARVRRQERLSSKPDLSEVIARGRSRPYLDTRPEDAILGYDESGLPT